MCIDLSMRTTKIRDESVACSARFLTGHGHLATPGNLYLAHVLSREAAVRLLDADPRRPAAEIDEAAAKEQPALFHGDGDPAQPRAAGAVIANAEDAMATPADHSAMAVFSV